MFTPNLILTLARTSAFALVCAWLLMCMCAGISTNAQAIPHAHADAYRQSQSKSHSTKLNIVIRITPTIITLGGASIARIDYYADSELIGSVIDSTTSNNLPASGSPYNWLPLASRTYSFTAQITDSIGYTATSAPITINITSANGETITFLHNDFAGSAIASTDAVGAVLWKENYTPFGDRAVKAVAGANNRQFFTGKPVDSETGLSYFGARYYDPVVGRFMGVDAVGFNPGNLQSFNRYAYGNNNPYRFVDPDGNNPVDALVSFMLDPFQKIGLMLGMNQHREARDYGSSMQDGGQYLKANLNGVQAIGDLTTAAMSVAALPIGVEATAVRSVLAGAATKEATTLYRAVGQAELNQIQKTGGFEAGQNSLGGKWFAETADHARQWGDVLNGKGASTILEVQLPRSQADKLMRMERLDGIGPARYGELNQIGGATIKALGQ